MIRKITLENFMSHGKTEIELADGLTVLTGPNNCGKSALVSALQIIAANGRTKHVMRHGAKVCRITVETDDDHTIIWERKKTTVKYNIDGEDVHRTGQGIPEELHDSLRLDKVITEVGASKNEYDIHFGEQKSPVFLLNESGSRAAAFFASSSDAARLVEMQHVHRARTSKARTEAKRLHTESEQNTARITAFAPIDAITESVARAENMQDELQSGQQRAKELAALITRLRSAATEATRLRNELNILNRLSDAETTPDDLLARRTQCDRLRSWLAAAERQTRIRDREKARCTALSQLQPLPAQHPAAELAVLIRRIIAAQQHHAVSVRIADCCGPLSSPPEMQPAESCRQHLRRLDNAITHHATAKQVHTSLLPLTAVPSQHDTTRAVQLIERLHHASTSRDQLQSRIAATASLTPPPTIESSESLRRTIAGLREAHRRHDITSERAEMLAVLRPIEPPHDLEPVRKTVDRLGKIIAEVERVRTAANEAKRKLSEHERAIREFVDANPKCETCGGSIDPETLMSTVPGSHDHDGASNDKEPAV
ncbi:AAA family ATPase [Rhodopirellula sallentina]|uniref:DNA repair ATPase-like protein n=1 Tax=Rhodopirellula sallentina SM41 TaxID=1263870 RepID=M5UA99_9BACT|nr:AAA family ATPase [Rhodopirellula sallentina]EMI52943.1 DNA repair ATPase-like protein [Rhodopirellula sallentina SM41]